MIKRTYFFTGYFRDTKNTIWGTTFRRSWFSHSHEVMKDLQDKYPEVQLQQFYRVK